MVKTYFFKAGLHECFNYRREPYEQLDRTFYLQTVSRFVNIDKEWCANKGGNVLEE